MIDIQHIAYLIKKHIVILLIMMIAGGAAAYAISLYVIRPVYSASADMIVNNKTDVTDALSSSDVSAASSLASTYSIILKSHVVLGQVIDDLDLPYSYAQLSRNVAISSVNNTQVMRITVKDHNAQTAKQIVSAIIELAPETIMQTVEAGSVKTVDKPWTTGKPVFPNYTAAAAIGVFTAFMMTIAVLLFLDARNHTIRTEDELAELTGIHVLGVIPIEEAQ